MIKQPDQNGKTPLRGVGTVPAPRMDFLFELIHILIARIKIRDGRSIMMQHNDAFPQLGDTLYLTDGAIRHPER